MPNFVRSLFAVSSLVLAVSAQAVVVGQDVIARPETDGAYQIDFVDVGHSVPSAGVLTSWSLYANNPGDVTLRVYRPLGGDSYSVVGENAVTATATGVNGFNIAAASQIAVQAGDLLGFHYDGTDLTRKVIAFTYGGGINGGERWSNWPIAPVGVGATLSMANGANENRGYSLAANVEAVPEPASMAALGLGALAAIRRRRKA